MIDKLIITIDDIARFRPMSKLIPNERITPFIRESQVQDLLPVLGDTLFYDFVNKFDNPSDGSYSIYQDLLQGKIYTPSGYASSVIYSGIIPMLSYFTLARYYQNAQVNATSYGVVQKNTEYSTSISNQSVQNSADYLRSLGISFQDGVIKFLSDNQTIYPLYQTGKKSVQNDIGVKFFSA